MAMIHTILHPTDLSENAKTAFELACALARDYGAELIVLHVYPPPINAAEAVDRERDNTLEEDLEARIRELVPHDPDIPIDYRVEEGAPAEVILNTARACDLIVMGTHGRSGVRRVLMGSVAEKVQREAPCPVLTIRPATHLPEDRPTPTSASPNWTAGKQDLELGCGD